MYSFIGCSRWILFDFGDSFEKIGTQKSEILDIIGGKGGGKPPTWQGKSEGLTEAKLKRFMST